MLGCQTSCLMRSPDILYVEARHQHADLVVRLRLCIERYLQAAMEDEASTGSSYMMVADLPRLGWAGLAWSMIMADLAVTPRSNQQMRCR